MVRPAFAKELRNHVKYEKTVMNDQPFNMFESHEESHGFLLKVGGRGTAKNLTIIT